MPLQVNDQISLLADILRSHQLDQCGSDSECQQLERLTNSLLQNPQTPIELRDTLMAIQTYSQNGGQAQSLEQHIIQSNGDLNQWMNLIDHM
ncbi:YtzH-like family protein [Pseudalkalibacillus sp. A8]|uniref:YtzH-like family protein n=1 Tax=Pseudalkalibacillus sp. A8 TaxID=3382641 RepID=UPI0038B514A0